MSSFLHSSLIQILVSIPALLLCLSVHEACHGFAAYALGDPTAKQEGRLTFDPLRHLDPIGTLCMLFFHVGWAKPVPINPSYFKNRRVGIALVSLAGPASNFVLALLALFLYYPLRLTSSPILTAIALMLYMTAVMSIGLGVFNLIPVPPLDGSRILLVVLPQRIYFQIMRYERVIFVILLAAVWAGVLDGVLGTFNDVVWDLLDLGTGYIDQIAYSAYYAAIGTVI